MKETTQTHISDKKMEEQTNAIQRLLDSGLSFALFRKPHADNVELILQTEGEARPVASDETELHGFIFAPFYETKHRPTLLIRPDITCEGWDDIITATQGLEKKRYLKLNQLEHSRSEYISVQSSHIYEERFKDIQEQLINSRFEKLVLTYCEECGYPHNIRNEEASVFLRGIEQFPNAMVYLTYTPTGGRWIGCTPELLLKKQEDNWHTVALAGTHAWGEGEWDTKNVHEQDVVRRYIKETLNDLGATLGSEQRSTMQIGQLMHIRTDIPFNFPHPTHIMSVVRALHPTPAVCGYPKEPALRYLVKCERGCRNYFTGYLGVIDGNTSAHLYVNLRCAQICKDATFYHAGGGITLLSLLWEEKQEIERKLQMLKSLV